MTAKAMWVLILISVVVLLIVIAMHPADQRAESQAATTVSTDINVSGDIVSDDERAITLETLKREGYRFDASGQRVSVRTEFGNNPSLPKTEPGGMNYAVVKISIGERSAEARANITEAPDFDPEGPVGFKRVMFIKALNKALAKLKR